MPMGPFGGPRPLGLGPLTKSQVFGDAPDFVKEVEQRVEGYENTTALNRTYSATGPTWFFDFLIVYPGNPAIEMPRDDDLEPISKSSLVLKEDGLDSFTYRFPPIPEDKAGLEDEWAEVGNDFVAPHPSADATMYRWGEPYWPHVDLVNAAEKDVSAADALDYLELLFGTYKDVFRLN